MSRSERSTSVKVLRMLRWLVPLAIIAGALGFRQVVNRPAPPAPDLPPIPVRVTRPDYGDLVRTLGLNGHIESDTMVTVLPLVSGILNELSVDIGQTVRKDQVIARIDAQRYELQLKQAEAAYLSSKSSYERLQQLYKANAASQQSYEQARTQYEAYSSQYELARIQLGYASVKSPIEGVVLVKHLSVGSIASPERPIVTIGSLDALVVKAQIPERHYETFMTNRQTMGITVRRAGGLELRGTVRSISPFVSAGTKNFETVIAVEDQAGTLRPGMFVSMEFELDRWEDVFSLPFEALSGGNLLWWVQDGKAANAAFSPTASSATAFAVPEEWADRDVIVEGHFFARAGSPVVVIGESR
jgi:membrane fusion protein, multidrug efflux system